MAGLGRPALGRSPVLRAMRVGAASGFDVGTTGRVLAA
jgi:hypothetical protein